MTRRDVPPEYQLGSAPVEPAATGQLKAIAAAIDDFLNPDRAHKQWGFIVLMFPFGEKPGRCNYMSNAQRDDVKVLLREQLAYFEGMPDTIKASGDN